jgi:polyferredoxin
MGKMGYPKGLIRYSTENAIAGRYDDRQILRRLLRVRTLLYSGLLLAVMVIVIAGIVLRTPVKMNIIRDRGNIVRELDDGQLENVYRVQIMNTREAARSFLLSARGIDGIELVVNEAQPIEIGPVGARIVALELRLPPGAVKTLSTPVWLKVEATDDAGVAREEKTVFIAR